MKWVVTFLLYLSTTFILSAQNDFRTGRVFLSNGDTVACLINYVNRSADYVQVRDANKSIKEYRISDLNGYELEGRVYLKKNVPIENDVYVYFLEVLALGKINLYYFKSKGNQDYYFLEKEGQIHPLIGGVKEVYKTDPITKYERTYLVPIVEYANTLKIQTADCAELGFKMSNIPYTSKAITKVVDTYNECMGGAKRVVSKVKQKKPLLKGGRLGMNYLGIIPIDGVRYYEPVPKPSIGVFLDIPFAGFNKNLSVHTELGYSPRYAIPTIEGKKVGLQTIALDYWDLQATLRYKPSRGAIRPLVGIGTFGSITRLSFQWPFVENFTLGYQGEVGLSVPVNKYSLAFVLRAQRARAIDFPARTYNLGLEFAF